MSPPNPERRADRHPTSEFHSVEGFQVAPDDPEVCPSELEAATLYVLDGNDPDVVSYLGYPPVQYDIARKIAAKYLFGEDYLAMIESDDDRQYRLALEQAGRKYRDELHGQALVMHRAFELARTRRNTGNIIPEPLIFYWQRENMQQELSQAVKNEPLLHFRRVSDHVEKLSERSAVQYAPAYYQVASHVGVVLGTILVQRLEERLPEKMRMETPSDAAKKPLQHLDLEVAA